MPVRTICAFVFTLTLSGAAAAQPFAALSLVGYEMTIIQAGHSTGSSRDTNIHQPMPMTDRALDLAALRAVDQVMRQARPDAKVVLLSGGDPAWAAAAKQDLTVGSPAFDALAKGLAKAAEQVGAHRVIVVLPARATFA
jgi:acetoin utilization deacetylase AcuC-like enzyme